MLCSADTAGRYIIFQYVQMGLLGNWDTRGRDYADSVVSHKKMAARLYEMPKSKFQNVAKVANSLCPCRHFIYTSPLPIQRPFSAGSRRIVAESLAFWDLCVNYIVNYIGAEGASDLASGKA